MVSHFKLIFAVFQIILIFHTNLLLGKPSVEIENAFNTKIHANLQKSMQTNQDQRFNIMVGFTAGTKKVLEAIADTRYPTRDDKLVDLTKALKANAATAQINVTQYLQQVENIKFTSYWIINEISVEAATSTIIDRLAAFEEVSHIGQDSAFELGILPTSDSFFDTFPLEQEPGSSWGIQKIQALEANAYLKNISSIIQLAEIRVATIDTGVLPTHETLRDNYIGEFGWFDPYDGTATPHDHSGHGTHVTGTIVGERGIGVFPSAKWLACKGCYDNRCKFSAIVSCAQFLVCPTTPDGLIYDCSKAPHVISNSYYGLRGNWLFDAMIDAWHVAQIIPVFCIGNSGPRCDTANSPGDRNVISVGSTNEDDAISPFSSKGPGVDPTIRMKPDFSSPGNLILSAYHAGDTAYKVMSGTSMATPHLAGLVAMILSYSPDMPYDKVVETLRQGVDTDLPWDGEMCEDIRGDVFPNYIFGHGRINALKTIIKLTQA